MVKNILAGVVTMNVAAPITNVIYFNGSDYLFFIIAVAKAVLPLPKSSGSLLLLRRGVAIGCLFGPDEAAPLHVVFL